MLKSSNALTFNRLDKTGIFCSAACALHCMAIPIISFASPSLGVHFENEWVHISLIILIIPIAVISFYSKRKADGYNIPIKFGILGLAFLIIAIMSEQIFNIEVEGLEVLLTAVGSTFLIIGHFLNMDNLKDL
jgi:hypothetical protein